MIGSKAPGRDVGPDGCCGQSENPGTDEQLATTDFVWQAPPTQEEWNAEGHQLAVALQRAVPGVQVWYRTAGGAERVVLTST